MWQALKSVGYWVVAGYTQPPQADYGDLPDSGDDSEIIAPADLARRTLERARKPRKVATR